MNKVVLTLLVLTMIGCSDEPTPEQVENERLKQQLQAAQSQLEYLSPTQNIQQPQPVYHPQPQSSQPIIVEQGSHDSGLQDMLLGGLIGHAIGSSGNNYSNNGSVTNHYSERVIERTPPSVSTISSKARLPKQSPKPAITPKPIVTSKPATSTFKGFRTTTPSTSKSFSSSRSFSGGFRGR